MTTEKRIPLHILHEITNGFSVYSRVGMGEYGDVYKGVYNGREVAVKLLHVDTVLGLDDRQYINEIGNLLRVKHPNIIQLLGYCYEIQNELIEYNGATDFSKHIYRVLCFEYLQGGSLDKHLHAQSFAPSWGTRYNIIKGICEGLNFLHQHEPQILHLDLKPANILLDNSMEPKLADFGLSTLFTKSHTHVTERVMGSRKYMPPEFLEGCKISPKNDVFSLGVVMMDIMIGPTGYGNSLEMVDVAQEILTKWSTVIEATSTYRSEKLIQLVHELKMMQDELDNVTNKNFDCMPKDSVNINAQQVRNRETSDVEQTLILGRTEEKHNILSMIEATSTYRCEELHQLQMDRAITLQNELESMLTDESAEPKRIPLSLLELITNRFSDDEIIGYGGCATVYKGMLRNGMIAVKKLLVTVDIDEKKFIKEVCCLMNAKHKNIVRFLGYCSESQGEMVGFNGELVLADSWQRVLCFEYLSEGSLEKKINDASCGHEWSKRYEIINGICDGLYYLHQNRIVHLDLKPANILLDRNMMPKIADFGLSRRLCEDQSKIITSNLTGTIGYIAPEYWGGGQITLKCDLYSLGIIIIEILTGAKGCPNIDDVRCVRTVIKS